MNKQDERYGKGKPKSAEHRAAISAALKGKKKTAEQLANFSAARKGHTQRGVPCTPERAAKIGAANRGRIQSTNERAMRSIVGKERATINPPNMLPAQKACRPRLKALWATSEFRVKMSKASKDAWAKRPLGICDICHEEKKMNQDHDHVTGKQRGKLCFNCNTTLGQMKDSPKLLRDAADYLEKWA
jgi:hypothetical protein